MSERDEIREGIQRLEFTFGFLSDEEVEEILEYLHSRGVVIRVEELPVITKKGWYYIVEPLVE